MKKAVIIFSGGVDSTTCLAMAKNAGFSCYALSFDFGQRHSVELTAAEHIAKKNAVAEHRIVRLPIEQWKGSALTDHTLAIPQFTGTTDIPITYVPARNTIFLAIALSWAEAINAYDIFIGVSHIDYSHYPDCRPEYIQAFEHLANLATKAGVTGNHFRIHAPLLHLSKAETIKKGLALGVNYYETISCYQANAKGHACGQCDSCTFRKKGFAEAGVADQTYYYQ